MRRRGYSLAELLVALTLLGVLLSGVAGVVARQWRMQAALDARRTARGQLAAGADALASVLRPVSARGDSADAADVVAAADTLLELRATIGASVICAVPDARTVELPPLSVDAPALSWWSAPPQPGDELLVHADADDTWRVVLIDAAGTNAAGCAGSPLLRAGDAGRGRLRLHLAAPPSVPFAIGAPARLLRRTRWPLYKATDGRWYLGQREWDGAAWSVVQPVAGPLRPPGARGGMSVVARDSAGVALGASGSIALRALDVVLRADVPAPGDARGRTQVDSVTVRVAVPDGR